MGNILRCCLACVLPCGALDLIRIVHINGEVEEYGRPISAKEVLDANPNHVISKPYSQGVTHRILIISPESDLKRGSIYLLIPTSAIPDKKKHRKSKKVDCSGTKDRLHSLGILDSTTCLLCNEDSETHEHLFFNCNYTTYLWGLAMNPLRMPSTEHPILRLELIPLSNRVHRQGCSRILA